MEHAAKQGRRVLRYHKKISAFIIISFLSLTLFLLTGCERSKPSKSEPPPVDYNETTWLQIEGFKSPGYDIYMSVGYGGEGDGCKFFSFGLGKDVSKSTHLHIDANISEDDLHYTLRYPLNFRQGECEFWAGGLEIRMEEYNDLDEKRYPKDKIIRRTKVFDDTVLVMNLYYQKQHFRDNLNLNPLNLYCQRTVHFFDIAGDDTDEEKPFFGAICHNTTSYKGMAGILGAYYEVEFLKEHNPLTVNLLISEDIKCLHFCSDEDMEKAKELEVKERMYEGSIYDKPTENPLNTRFIPSEKLFEDFKKRHKIEE